MIKPLRDFNKEFTTGSVRPTKSPTLKGDTHVLAPSPAKNHVTCRERRSQGKLVLFVEDILYMDMLGEAILVL